jgi:oligopeptide/dipeptide ABC transporter ATP-binding protein
LAANPSLIIADEPVSSLDVSVQAQILTVLKTLRDEMNLTMLFISHDLSVVRYISHRVAVMFKGRIVETGTTNALFTKPQHPYTIALLAAVPEPDPDKRFYDQVHHTLIDTGATVSEGCAFRNRCPFSFEKCIHHKPELSPVSDTSTHLVACFRT